MWYKFLNRNCDEVRIYKRANLKFNQDDIGMFRHKFLNSRKEILFRMARNEGNLRGCGVFYVIGLFGLLSYFKSDIYDPIFTAPKILQQKRQQQEINRKAKQLLYYNKLNVPTRPTRKLEEFMLFIQSGEALNKNFDFMMFALDIHTDQLGGLDSYTSPEDENLVAYYTESKKRLAH